MAKESEQISSGVTPPGGMNDNAPLTRDQNYYSVSGVNSRSQRFLERMNGKQLVQKLDSPILNIHGNLRGILFVETVSGLLMLTGADIQPPI